MIICSTSATSTGVYNLARWPKPGSAGMASRELTNTITTDPSFAAGKSATLSMPTNASCAPVRWRSTVSIDQPRISRLRTY